MAASSVSATEAPPSAPAEGDNQLDGLLLSALANPRDRLTILKLDVELERFLRESRQVRLEFPPMSSYQRLIVHRVAHYFRLDHAVFDVDGTKRSIVLFKTPQSRIPALRFTDLIEQEEAAPIPSVKIMRRADSTGNAANIRSAPTSPATPQAITPTVLRKSDVKPAANGNDHSDAPAADSNCVKADIASASPDGAQEASAVLQDRAGKTLEEREADYARARARIFNAPSEGPNAAAPSQTPSPPPSSPPPATRVSSPSASIAATATATATAAPSHASTLPSQHSNGAPSTASPKGDVRRPPPPQAKMAQPPPPPWESAEFVPMEGPEAGGYFPAGVPPINSLWGDSFFYQPDPQNAFSRSAFAPPLGAPPPPAVPRPFIPDPRTPLPYAAVAAGKGIPKTHSNPSVSTNGREVPSPPLPLPVPVPVHMSVPMPPPPDDGASVLGFYASDKPPEAIYAPIGYQNYPIAPWPIYGPFAAYPHPAVYGPYPTGPISASLEYERRPPARSTELFDPKAPTQRRTAPPQTQMHSYPYPQLYDPSVPVQPGRGSMQSQPPRGVPSGGARPMRGEKPAASRAAGKPYYDYSQPVTGEANTAVPAVPNHILEIFNIAPSIKPDEPGDAFTELKSAGASVKILGGGAVLAVFRSSAVAKAALARIKSASFELRVWIPVVAQTSINSESAETERAKSPVLP